MDTEDWSFGNGLVKDWSLPESTTIEADVGSKSGKKYRVLFPCVDLYVPETSYTQTVCLKLSELVALLNSDADSLNQYADRFDLAKYRHELAERVVRAASEADNNNQQQ